MFYQPDLDDHGLPFNPFKSVIVPRPIGWITTVEVSRVQAEGNLALADETAKRIQKSASLIVATYQGGPISVLPLKVPVEAKPKTIKP